MKQKSLSKDSRKWFDTVCDKIEVEIKTGKETMPTVLMKNKESIVVCPMFFNGNEGKVRFRNELKGIILKGNYKEYIMVMCCVVTQVDKKNDTAKSVDAIMVTYHSPNNKLMETFTFEGTKLIDRINMNEDGGWSSEWDVWNTEKMKTDVKEEKLFDEAKKKFRDSKNQPYFEQEEAIGAMAKTMSRNREYFKDMNNIIKFGKYGMKKFKDENEKRDLGQGTTLSAQEFCDKLFDEYKTKDEKK